jgi:hypothetical protein
MKPFTFTFLISCIIFLNTSHAQNHTLAVDQCITENSGADSVDRLQNIYWKIQRSISKQEHVILVKLKKKRQADDLTDTHYKLAVSSLMDASKKFTKFRERQCDFAVGASGAVASGSGQVRWSCLIRLADWRFQYLKSEK